jgi:hypothetical protein
MLNPKLQKYADRIKSLIEEGETLSRTCTPLEIYLDILSPDSSFIQRDTSKVFSWITKSTNALINVFGENDTHCKIFVLFSEISPDRKNLIDRRIGCLKAALSDIEDGFMQGQDFFIASEIFDSVLEQAKYLNEKGYKDPAAVLGRTVIEDALRRLARKEGLDDSKKAAMINNELKAANIYHQPMWRQVEVWLDIGNKAAHGDFSTFDENQVKLMLEGIGQFLANHFV